jgi:hypothetical protein
MRTDCPDSTCLSTARQRSEKRANHAVQAARGIVEASASPTLLGTGKQIFSSATVYSANPPSPWISPIKWESAQIGVRLGHSVSHTSPDEAGNHLALLETCDLGTNLLDRSNKITPQHCAITKGFRVKSLNCGISLVGWAMALSHIHTCTHCPWDSARRRISLPRLGDRLVSALQLILCRAYPLSARELASWVMTWRGIWISDAVVW